MDHNATLTLLLGATNCLNFFDFPAEVRLMIYRLLLITDKPIQPPVHRGDGRQPRRQHIELPCRLYMAMLLANKRLSREVAHFTYSSNTFLLSLKYQRQWFATIGRHNAATIERLVLDCGGKETRALDCLEQMQNTVVKRAPNLRDVTYRLVWHNPMSVRGVEHLLNKAITPTWARMKNLEQITVVKAGVYPADNNEKVMYKRLAFKARVPVKAAQVQHTRPDAPPARVYLIAEPERPRAEKPKKKVDDAGAKRTLAFLKKSHHN
ncbi:hypothetical protein B0H67DRAFT_648091 [Lasiosphaeris hirsuta]|uniref:Uncharacterized protein n=1 Tax=Lasiosphaeris hirsuta TaxID=260670 RepID=A0AA40A2C3_9PEZI|nr:hypothetical protein B0H67DRAFT_648091 [Lasiosphaeris hirsuta]